MPRATNAPARRSRRKKVLKRASGFQGMQKSSYRVAVHKVARALAYAYHGRKIKKRDYRAAYTAYSNSYPNFPNAYAYLMAGVAF